MAGKLKTAAAAAGFFLLPVVVFAAETSSPLPTASPNPEAEKRSKEIPPREKPSPELDAVRKAIDALSPEQKKRFQENFSRWLNLTPEEKKALLDRNEARRKWMKEELDAALADSGLQLQGERREQFLKRYGEERRKVEEQLHKEMAEKRKPLVKEIIEKLRAEFSATAPSASVTPAPVTPVP